MPPFSPEAFDPADVVNKLRGADVDVDRMRRVLFNRALQSGDLEESIEDLYQSFDFDEDESDYDVFRQNVTSEDFPGRIPYRGFEIDPDYEDLGAFHLAGQNPKVRQFLESGQNFELSNPQGTQEAIYQAYRRGDINDNDLRLLRTAGYSDLLSRGSYDPESVDVAAELVRGVTRNDAPYEELIPRVGDVLDTVDPVVTPVSRAVENYNSAVNQLGSMRGYNPFTQRIRSNLPLRSRPSIQDMQLGLPLVPQDPEAQRILERGELPESFDQLVDEAGRLRDTVRSSAGNPTNPNLFGPSDILEAERRLVLPQVEQLLGSRAAVTQALTDRRLDEGSRNSLYNVARDLNDFSPAPGYGATLSALDMFPSQMDPVISASRGGTPGIPGLQDELTRLVTEAKEADLDKGLQKVQQFLEKYPEVGPYLQSSRLASTPGLERDLGKLAEYVDISQQIGKPEDRARIYNRMIQEKNVDPDVLDQIERDYRSGEQYKQQRALRAIDEFAGPEYRFELEKQAVPAFSKRFPVVGGGGYGMTAEGKKDLDLSRRRIFERAADFSNLMQEVPESVRELFGKGGVPYTAETEQRYSYDWDTGKAYRDPQGDYGLVVNRGLAPSSMQLFDPQQLSRVESENVLKFLRDNPITAVNTIDFKTKIPGERYSYEASADIPRPVFSLMEQDVREQALKGLYPGTLVVNRPIPTEDIIGKLEEAGVTPEESSTLRRAERFIGKQPNQRAAAYRLGGFGPLTNTGEQIAYVNAEGNVVALQPNRADLALRGGVDVTSQGANVTQSRIPLTTRAYYSADPITSAVRGASELVRQNPLGVAGGAALTLTNEDVAKAIEQNQYGQAATAAAKDVATGTAIEQALKLAGAGLQRTAPQAASKVLPLVSRAAGVGVPAAVGAGLIFEGRTGSATERLVNKAADVVPGLRANPRTDVGRRAGNEARYILNSLLRGRLPYSSR